MTEFSSRLTQQTNEAKPRILIVDDEPGIVKPLAEMLREDGYSCLGCHSRLEALHVLSTQRFDVALSDVHMPGIDGMELLRQVREEHPELPMVMVTGEGDIRVCVQAMKEGAYDYLLKPLNRGAVLMSVKQVLKRRRMEEELVGYRLHLEEIVDKRTSQLRKALAQIEQNFEETLPALVTALELRDNGTAGHSRRVTTYAVQIAKTMGCSREKIHSLAIGALVHDIGKISTPDAILRKTRALTREKREVMRTHVIVGYNLLDCIGSLSDAAELALPHHEHFDGTGYPQRLVGATILLAARVFAVAETMDVMTSDRPYHQATSFAAAREEIILQSGKQFDPVMVSAFASIDAAAWEEIRPCLERNNSWRSVGMSHASPPPMDDILHSFKAHT